MVHFSESPRLVNLFTNHAKLADEVRQIIAAGKVPGIEARSQFHRDLEVFVDPTAPRRGNFESAARGGQEQVRLRGTFEAIVRLIGRPPLLVRQGTYVAPEATSEVVPKDTLDYIAALQRPLIDFVIARTGRVDIVDIPGMPFLGTGWIVDKPATDVAVMVTNRHVASEFARADGLGGFQARTAPNFRPYVAEIGFFREHDVNQQEQLRVSRVLYIAGDRDPDIALIEIKGDYVKTLGHLDLTGPKPKIGDEIGVVGYPAYDSRNDDDAIARYFDGIFNFKRFAFGEVIGVSEEHPEFSHDATTLGGNSGSAIFDLHTGKAIGLHFAGDYKTANFAVPIEQVKRAVAGLKTTAVVRRDAGMEAISDGVNPVAFYTGRDGYKSDFLGRDMVAPLPGLGEKWSADAAEVKDADTGATVNELKYRHFSVFLCKSRKLPLFTAVNIDGALSKRLGRVDKWFVDGRVSEAFQTGNEAFSHNPLDRGHMVRREDPVWGTMEDAREANIDTFHYTNCAPQHEALNQRDWLALEDYVLGNARTNGLMVSVFTGPILRDDDPLYRDIVKLPREFWKVAVILDAETNELSATGYVLSQGDLIQRLTEAFVYGAFRTYQVPVALIASETGLDFSTLAKHDPLARRRRNEGLEGTTDRLFVPVASSADIMLA